MKTQRYLKHRASRGQRGADITKEKLASTDHHSQSVICELVKASREPSLPLTNATSFLSTKDGRHAGEQRALIACTTHMSPSAYCYPANQQRTVSLQLRARETTVCLRTTTKVVLAVLLRSTSENQRHDTAQVSGTCCLHMHARATVVLGTEARMSS